MNATDGSGPVDRDVGLEFDFSTDPLSPECGFLRISQLSQWLSHGMEERRAALACAERRANEAEQIRRIVSEKLREWTDLYAAEVRAAERYNREIERINELSRRAGDLLGRPSPARIEIPPAVERILADKDLLLQSIVDSAAGLNGMSAVSGVYFLLRDDELVYIGQSVNVANRIAAHCGEGTKQFNRACFIPVDRTDLNLVESALIALFWPEHNKHPGMWPPKALPERAWAKIARRLE